MNQDGDNHDPLKVYKYEKESDPHYAKNDSDQNIYDTPNITDKKTAKIKDNPNETFISSLNKAKESQHLYENERERNRYENIKQCLKEENEYEEINFATTSSKMLLKSD